MKFVKNAPALIAKGKLLLNKKAPEIWVGAGIITIIGGTVLACVASRKMDGIMDNHDELVQDIDLDREDMITEEKGEDEEAVISDTAMAKINSIHHKELMKARLATSVDIFRAYAPSVIVMAAGIGMVINGHHILCKRNAALLAAYTTLDETFKKYRARVVEKYGAEIDEDLYSGRSWKEETRTEVGEDGKKTKVKEKIPVVGETLSPYAKFFDETCSEWKRGPDYNHIFLTCQQNAANDKLKRQGFLFLNDVYSMLGMQLTPTGAICGWLMPEEGDPLADGDTYVDFGFKENHEFINGIEKSILLDFNCQGVIYDKI